MKAAFGFSNAKDPSEAISQAYRNSLQRLRATKADFCFVVYSYDYNLDAAGFGVLLKKHLKYVPHLGCSSAGAWTPAERFTSERGIVIMSVKDPNFDVDFISVHSLREKEENWATEVGRQLGDSQVKQKKNKVKGQSGIRLIAGVLK